MNQSKILMLFVFKTGHDYDNDDNIYTPFSVNYYDWRLKWAYVCVYINGLF